MRQHYFCFYVSVLSALVIDFYFDHFLFLCLDGIITPLAGSPDAPPGHSVVADADAA